MWSFVFSSPATTANDLLHRRISIPDFIHYIFVQYILILEKEPVFPFKCWALYKGTTGSFFIMFLVWRGPWPGTRWVPQSKPWVVFFIDFFSVFFNKHKSFSLAPIFAFLCSLNSLIYSNGVVCNEATTCGKILNKRHKLEHDFGLLFHWVKLWILIQHPPLKLLLFFQGNLWCVPKLSPLVTQL